MSENSNPLVEALIDQKEIFGDNLFEQKQIDTSSIKEDEYLETKETTGLYMSRNSLFESFQNCDTLDSLYGAIHKCQKCTLGSTRTNFVFGVGNPNAEVMIIGEAPGANEDKEGIPFVGRAGRLLTDILKAINFDREDVYIANILKCRPPQNRNPLPAEVKECTPYLYIQMELIKPKAILCLGLVAATNLLNQKLSLTKMRGNIFEVQGIKTMVTYHPAALLRNPNWKRGCWEDVQKFRKLYDSLKS